MGSTTGRPLNPDDAIQWLRTTFRSVDPDVIAGVADDDCGVLRLGRTLVVVTADFLNATPIAEQTGLGNERTLGRLAVAATIADLIGSGATPRALIGSSAA